ncbi:MAG: serine--tRNA ligase [Candidatus Yanofskybacteria bacterium CG10_big_fil_rev_8_21_14_0_10_36_16]|uniref:Serine--tRNA ligase n=1 Tax=Candidatus Yanofskybacteria bacterium CG10_big_fil_rev_8_21_14_0_10_36_16 TaxID=1975096 RepID=A0A2J0Q767_9BACT|nr:MAG: serine--tRNA ligase [Candidatus Yanofskybacteria bacterium CG10_big_fil_rev_8_21_14_0_10_36_16]
MLDIKFIRENQDLVKDAIRKKRIEFNLDELIAVDERRRHVLMELENKRASQNKKSDSKPTPEEIEILKKLKEEIKLLEEENRNTQEEFNRLMLLVPQVPDPSVPEGKDDEDNVEVIKWGEIPAFDFKVKDHIELMESLDLVDFDRGVKVSGFRGYFLKNEAVLLSHALWALVLDKLIKKGFTPIFAPAIARESAFNGTGWLPQGKDEVYKVGEDEYLVGTSEVSTMAYYSDEVLQKKDLPKKFIAFSPCFRSEAGSHGKDTKGLIRVHEFYKMEQVILCRADHEESVKWHEEITQNSEEIMQDLEIPYHVVVNSSGDLGLGQVKKYDIEGWMPSQQKYRETHSSSYFHDFQTRRLNIRYRDEENKMQFAHSLNNTAIATPRILAMIVENYQTKEGTVKVPKVLQKFVGVKQIGKK